MKNSIFKNIREINQLSVALITDQDNKSVIQNFTEKCIDIFGADFGFALGKLNSYEKSELIYKSEGAPAKPTLPKNKKSYLLIPVRYGDHVYGNIVICYKKARNFTEEELALAEVVRNTIGHIVTINWLIEKEQKALAMAERQKEMEVLLSQEKSRTEFVANAAHELRTPLAIMKGNVDLALMDKGDLKGKEQALRAVGAEIRILSEILQDLTLLTSPASSGENIKQVINGSPINLGNLITQMVKRLSVVAKDKKVSIQVKIKDKKGLLIWGDEKYLSEKLFLNLLKNAITYNKRGGRIVIEIYKNKNLNKNWATVKISDNGIGILKEDLPEIFERFYRVDKAHTHDSHGNHSGLGLAIAKWVAEAHGGSISVKSIYGKGSVFSVILPISDEARKNNKLKK